MADSPSRRGPDPKEGLRAALLSARRALVSARNREADDAALAAQVDLLATALDLGPGDTVAAYEALRTEPPMAASITALVARGIRVIVPITLGDNDLDWCDVTDPGRTPLGTGAISAARLVLTPGLAVDTTGTRLGRGGGSYDRALVRRDRGARVLVVLHPGELRDDPLPAEPHDEAVDGVLTVDGVLPTRR